MEGSVEHVWARLGETGLRRTPQREAVIETLARQPAGVVLPVLLQLARRRSPGLGERTVERTLGALVDLGVVDNFPGPSGTTLYRLCGGGHHHHLVCSVCGAVAEIADCDVSDWAQAQGTRHGFVVDGHDVTVFGRCATCRS